MRRRVGAEPGHWQSGVWRLGYLLPGAGGPKRAGAEDLSMRFGRLCRGPVLAAVFAFIVRADSSLGASGTVVVPRISGHPTTQPFSGHRGWVDAFQAGYGKSASARIGDDGRFTLPDQQGPTVLIAMFDRIETPPLIVPAWPVRPGDFDVLIPTEYACVPEGTRDQWDKQYKTRASSFHQTFVPRCTQIYGLSIFDGPKIIDWGNKIQVRLQEEGPQGKVIQLKDRGSPDPTWEGRWEELSCGPSDRELPRVGWRHGNLEVVPGKTYAIRAGGYRSPGGRNFELDAYVRPDKGDGYAEGRAFGDDKPLEGDLCCLIFGNSNGQLVENQIRTEEWEILIPRHRPTLVWGQTFVSHGVSLAGVSFWASSGGTEQIMCEVRIREDGPWGALLKPAKVARSHESPLRPVIRYPDMPGQMAEYAAFYKLPCQLFQVAYLPDELPLKPGRTYYVEVVATKPLMMYADGDYYGEGFAFYEGLKVDRQEAGRSTKHSARWTLAMSIVTYMKKGGQPLVPTSQPQTAPATRTATQPASQPASRPTTAARS